MKGTDTRMFLRNKADNHVRSREQDTLDGGCTDDPYVPLTTKELDYLDWTIERRKVSERRRACHINFRWRHGIAVYQWYYPQIRKKR